MCKRIFDIIGKKEKMLMLGKGTLLNHSAIPGFWFFNFPPKKTRKLILCGYGNIMAIKLSKKLYITTSVWDQSKLCMDINPQDQNKHEMTL